MTRFLLGLTLITLVWVVAAWFLSYRYVASHAFATVNEHGEFVTTLESDAGRLAVTREQTRIVASPDGPPESAWQIAAATDEARNALRLNQLVGPDVPHWGITGYGDNRIRGWAVRYHVFALALAVIALGLIWRILVTTPDRVQSDEKPAQPLEQ